MSSIRCIDTIDALGAQLREARTRGRLIGLVPTMGALHEGHRSLIEWAKADGCDVIVTTIFVNPLQFAAHEDLAKYPRDLNGDTLLAQAAGATHLFTPDVAEMYPFGANNVLTKVSVAGLTDVLDGVARPGHFDGVATVVAKLFALVGESRAYFGEKDFQQLAVVRRMALDLSFPVTIVGCPTIREGNGLARSSRNRYLTDNERERASVISTALKLGVEAVASGATGPETSRAMEACLQAEPTITSIDYAACVEPDSLAPAGIISSEVRLLIAVRVGTTRLIDNCAALPR